MLVSVKSWSNIINKPIEYIIVVLPSFRERYLSYVLLESQEAKAREHSNLRAYNLIITILFFAALISSRNLQPTKLNFLWFVLIFSMRSPVLIFYLLINIFKWIFWWRNIHWKFDSWASKLFLTGHHMPLFIHLVISPIIKCLHILSISRKEWDQIDKYKCFLINDGFLFEIQYTRLAHMEKMA